MTDQIDRFDAVIMLTWSNWNLEPRSNRYHYATRFAQHCHVYFVQETTGINDALLETTDNPNITIVHAGNDYGFDQSERLQELFAKLDVRHPLLFVYNCKFLDFIALSSNSYVAYHASEDHVQQDFKTLGHLSDIFLKVMDLTDILVAVSDGVHDSYIGNGAYAGRSIVLKNGCDFEFWRSAGASKFQPQKSGRPAALFQGGINSRLDFGMLFELADNMPDWDFIFCGRSSDEADWSALCGKSNVNYLGELKPDQLPEIAKHSCIGLIPFRDEPLMRVSLPLKAFEYVACGLPVVSSPIDALMHYPDLFSIASTAAEFENEMRRLAPTRCDANALRRRQVVAAEQSYDIRFAELRRAINQGVPASRHECERYNVLVLYDDASTHVKTIEEHLNAFKNHSRNNVVYLPCTNSISQNDCLITNLPWDIDLFDVIVVHYSVRVCLDGHLNPIFIKPIRNFNGIKILFIQDDYNWTESTRICIEKLRFDIVLTCVPEDYIDLIYPRQRFGNTEFIATLTGYVPDLELVNLSSRPMAERKLKIVYRGRELPHHYGDLAREKYAIGIEVKRIAEERGVLVDIAVDTASRIYGDDWYDFLASGRSTLGTESGSNVFDFDGRLGELSRAHSDMPYEQFRERYLAGRQGPVRMNQISPKLFEAIQRRTALVLFEGDYSGILKPNVHYLPLRKDYSNIDYIFNRLEDVPFLEDMTDRAYCDIIASGKYSYRNFFADFDNLLDRHIIKARRCKLIEAPIVYRRRDNEHFAVVADNGPVAALLSREILLGRSSRNAILDAYTARGSDMALRAEKERLKLQPTSRIYLKKMHDLKALVDRLKVAAEKKKKKIHDLKALVDRLKVAAEKKKNKNLAGQDKAMIRRLYSMARRAYALSRSLFVRQ